jgi:hypothetical protein
MDKREMKNTNIFKQKKCVLEDSKTTFFTMIFNQVFKRNLVLKLPISACVRAFRWSFKRRHANNSTTN